MQRGGFYIIGGFKHCLIGNWLKELSYYLKTWNQDKGESELRKGAVRERTQDGAVRTTQDWSSH